MPAETQMDEWDDPCFVAREMKRALYKLTSGQLEASFQYQSLGVLRSATWSRGSVSDLKDLLRQAEDECAQLKGEARPNRRFALEFGGRRRRWPL